MKKPLPAFSFTDVLAAMVISLLVVGISFAVFRFAYNRVYAYNETTDNYKRLYQLYAAMQDDFGRAANISFGNNELLLTMPSQKKCTYSFLDEMIVRETEASRDTFRVENREAMALFNGSPQMMNGVIDELNFTVQTGNTLLPYKFVKEYSAEMNMEYELNNNP